MNLEYVACPKCGEKYIKLPKLGYDTCEKCRKQASEKVTNGEAE